MFEKKHFSLYSISFPTSGPQARALCYRGLYRNSEQNPGLYVQIPLDVLQNLPNNSKCRSEGFPNGIFHPCALLARALARWDSCRRVVVVAVGIIWKFRSTFRPGNYIVSFSYGFGVVVRDIREWRPGFYTEFRYKSYEHSGLAWGAISKKVFVLT